MGVPIPLGTGLFKLVHKTSAPVQVVPRKRLFERTQGGIVSGAGRT
jgi:hypothetical protein